MAGILYLKTGAKKAMLIYLAKHQWTPAHGHKTSNCNFSNLSSHSLIQASGNVAWDVKWLIQVIYMIYSIEWVFYKLLAAGW